MQQKRKRMLDEDQAVHLTMTDRPSDADSRNVIDLDDEPNDKWQGWAEIESDPAIFHVMLKEMGVRGVAVKEIFSLDTEMLNFIPRPVYGVIFLFKWREDKEFVDTRFKPGSRVWFANQTVDNACATYALLNIINNVPDIHLGPHLDHFKDFTKDFTPALRGVAVANFEFVKHIHSSFTRKMDRLNGDLFMKSQIHIPRGTRKKRKIAHEEADQSHHFVAFLPIDDVVWKLDGLEWQPRSLGKVQSDDWIRQIRLDLESRMSRCEDDNIDFAILALVKDPLNSAIEELAMNVKNLQQLECLTDHPRRDANSPKAFGDTILGSNSFYGLDENIISGSRVSEAVSRIVTERLDGEASVAFRDLCLQQTRLRLLIKEEQSSQQQDAHRVHRRRHDCGDAISQWLRFLVHRKEVANVLAGME